MDTLQTLMIVFIIITAVAVVLQLLLLAGMAMAIKRTAKKVKDLASQWEVHGVPTLDAARALLTDSKPRIEMVLHNLAETTTKVKLQVDKVSDEFDDLSAHTRLHLYRLNEMLTNTMDQVEEAGRVVNSAVVGPARRASGVLHGLNTAISVFFGRNREPRNGGQSGDMFI